MKKVFLFLFLSLNFAVFAQQSEASLSNNDIKELNKTDNQLLQKSPKTASLLSAVVPGAGHIYLKKYHKTAIIWAGIGAGIYGIAFNQRFYKQAKESYIARLDDDPNTVSHPDFDGNTNSQILESIDFYRGNRDLSAILTTVGYFLNIIWASVDAHLLYFDVSEDISLNIHPSILPYKNPSAGLTLAFTLK